MNIIKIVVLVIVAFVFAFAVNFPRIFFGIAAIHIIVGIVSFIIFRNRHTHRRRWNAADTVTVVVFVFMGLLSPLAIRRI